MVAETWRSNRSALQKISTQVGPFQLVSLRSYAMIELALSAPTVQLVTHMSYYHFLQHGLLSMNVLEPRLSAQEDTFSAGYIFMLSNFYFILLCARHTSFAFS